MAIIKVLDKNTACRIAAGEVVERPVSVVKELVENSLDAGADTISVAMAGGGLEAITVVDNGCGMSQEDTPLAFQRHATSKINDAADLSCIRTLGFRGEALPSIASVSDLLVKTRTPDCDEGYVMHIRGGSILEFGPVGCPVGTFITVTDLFFNTPARRKHLKTKSTEGGLINDLLYKLSLIRPGVRFALEQRGRDVFRSPGTGKLVDAMAAVYGVETAGMMIPVSAIEGDITVDGLVSKPEITRSTRQQITLAVNGRLVRSSTVNMALDDAFKGLIAGNRYPLAVLYITIPPGLTDVNIHPAKTEIKIENEDQLARLISTTVRNALQTANLIPTAGISVSSRTTLSDTAEPFRLSFHDAKPHYPGHSNGDIHHEMCPLFLDGSVSPARKRHVPHTVNDTGNDNQADRSRSQVSGATPTINQYGNLPSQHAGNERGMEITGEADVLQGKNGIKPLSNLAGMKNGSPVEETALTNMGACSKEPVITEERPDYMIKRFPDLQVVGQLLNMYIICQNENNVYLIDQHAAHERVLFEHYHARLLDHNPQIQYLLAPLSLNLRPHEKELLREYRRELEALGFVMEDFGRDSLLLRGIPGDSSPRKSESLIADVVETILEQGKPGGMEAEFALSAMLACKAAVKAGEKLALRSMQSLVEQLAAAKEPFTCPHGRPTLVYISRQELNVMFKRT